MAGVYVGNASCSRSLHFILFFYFFFPTTAIELKNIKR